MRIHNNVEGLFSIIKIRDINTNKHKDKLKDISEITLQRLQVNTANQYNIIQQVIKGNYTNAKDHK